MKAVIQAKKKKVEELKKKIDSSLLLLLASFQKFTVSEMSSLRKELRSCGAEYKVIKNTLIKKALVGSNWEELDKYLVGNIGLLLGYEDPVLPLKTLVKFMGETEKGDLKAGVVEKSILGEKELRELSKLPSREVLLGKMVGGFQAPIYGLVNVLQGLIRKLVYVLDAITQRERKGG